MNFLRLFVQAAAQGSSWQVGRVLVASVALFTASCDRSAKNAPPGGPGGPGGPMGPMQVGVMTVQPKQVTLTQDLPGRISAFRVAEVRARVNGIVLKRHFTEGRDVKEGDLLYEIDPAPYQAALESAKGTMARAQANLATAKAKEERYLQLKNAQAISKQDYDDALAASKTFEADVLSGEAAIQTAQINLGYTKVTAPISGRIGLSQVTEGAYVQMSAATLLATIQQLDPVYVDVSQSSTELLRLKADLTSGRLKADEKGHARVKLFLEDGTAYAQEGTLEMADVTVNAMTNTVMIRAIFPNAKHDLLPGMFVRARLEEGSSPDAILVPQFAVTRNGKGEPTTMVVGAEGKVELRVLKIPRAVGNEWLVAEGLKAGDQVIVDSLQRIRPGMPVTPGAPAAAGGAPAQVAGQKPGAH